MERFRVEKPDVILSIDPDIDKSGFSRIDIDTRKIQLFSLTFPEVIKMCDSVRKECESAGKRLKIIVEAGWINKGYWHVNPYDSKAMAARKGHDVGLNHGTGINLVSYLKSSGYDVEEVRPLRKCWKGKDGKITAEEFKEITGYDKRSSQDCRDAGLIGWIIAGFPVRIKSAKNKQKRKIICKKFL